MSYRGKYWLCTIFPTEDDLESGKVALINFFQSWPLAFWQAQWEVCPDTKRLHIQGYVGFKERQRLSQVRQLRNCHWDPRRGSHKQAVDYTSKDESLATEEDINEAGFLAPIRDSCDVPAVTQGKRNDLIELKEFIDEGGHTIADVAENFFGVFLRHHKGVEKYMSLKEEQRSWKTKVFVLFGLPGTGKSTLAWRVCGDEAYPATKTKWFDRYRNGQNVVFDDYYGQLPYSQLLNLLDATPCIVETKGGTVQWAPRIVVITSNNHPRQWYDADKFPWEIFQNDGSVIESALLRRIEAVVNWKSYEDLSKNVYEKGVDPWKVIIDSFMNNENLDRKYKEALYGSSIGSSAEENYSEDESSSMDE